MPTDIRRTRIVATLGPASSDGRTIGRLIRAGLDVARLNMSHGDHESHAALIGEIRRQARRLGRPIGIMADLQGPKVRLGRFDGEVSLRRGARLTLTTRARETNPSKLILPVDYRHLPEETARGHEILLADGAVRVQVDRVHGHRVYCTVLEGRSLLPRAGFSLPQATAVRSPLTAKDRRDLSFAIESDVDFIALSFVRRAEDVAEARRLIRRRGGHQKLVAKVETIPAVRHLDGIISGSDAVMVARGDLGVELPPEQVPIEQKRIIGACNAAGKPVITATQMLESMRTSSRPTRAEASDVANAVLDGTWAVMLSAETASGEYPMESVRMMDRIAREAESYMNLVPRKRRPQLALSVSEGIAEAGAWIAFDVGAAAVVALTRSGATARQVARFQPALPVFAYTPDPRVLRQMTLLRSITPRSLAEQKSFRRAVLKVAADLRRRREVGRGDLIVVLGGDPHEPMGVTNRLVVHQC